MTAHARYMFDTVFPGRHTAQTNHASVPKFTDADMQASRDASFQEGLAAGRRESADKTTLMLDQKMEALLSLIQNLENTLPQEVEKVSALAADLAFVSARTLASELIAREPTVELELLFSECISQVKEAPHLVIRVPPTDLSALRKLLEKIAEKNSYEGKLVLLAENEMREGDCHIEWAEGGITRSREELEHKICTLIASRYRPEELDDQAELPGLEQTTADEQMPAPEGIS